MTTLINLMNTSERKKTYTNTNQMSISQKRHQNRLIINANRKNK